METASSRTGTPHASTKGTKLRGRAMASPAAPTSVTLLRKISHAPCDLKKGDSWSIRTACPKGKRGIRGLRLYVRTHALVSDLAFRSQIIRDWEKVRPACRWPSSQGHSSARRRYRPTTRFKFKSHIFHSSDFVSPSHNTFTIPILRIGTGRSLTTSVPEPATL